MRDPDSLALKLDNIDVGERKILVNVPRFHRGVGGSGVKPFNKTGLGLKAPVVGGVGVQGNRGIKDNMNHAYVTRNKVNHLIEVEAKLIFDDVDPMIWSRFSKAYVGVVKTPGMTYNLQDIFDMEGYFSIKVTPLGANLCLLEDREDSGLGI